MKLLCFSDAHGQEEKLRAMEQGVQKSGAPDAVLFAGDGSLSSYRPFEGIPYYEVRGNCDLLSKAADEVMLPFGPHHIYLTHGHLHRVKQTLDLLASAAKSRGAIIAVYGHTHRQGLDLINTIYCLNPGALKNGEYALLHLAQDGSFKPKFCYIKP